MGYVFGQRSSAVSGFFTVARILLRTNSARYSFAMGLIMWSEKQPRNSTRPLLAHASS